MAIFRYQMPMVKFVTGIATFPVVKVTGREHLQAIFSGVNNYRQRQGNVAFADIEEMPFVRVGYVVHDHLTGVESLIRVIAGMNKTKRYKGK